MKQLRDIVSGLFLDGVEAGRVLRLMPLLIIVSLLVYIAKNNPRSPIPMIVHTPQDTSSRTIYSTREISDAHIKFGSDANADTTTIEQVFEPFDFDPNTLDLAGFQRLGFSARQAQVIVNYRQAGARFDLADDFARCYSVSDEIFDKLKPYIKIEPRKKSRELTGTNLARDRGSVAEVSVAAQDSLLFDSARKARAKELFLTPRDTVDFPVELNSADSATLVLVRGIGSLTAGRIVEYREKLGGFVSVEQLSQVKGMMEHNYLMILKEIYVDSCNITKIDINFASPKQMSQHPYISAKGLAKLVKNRQLKGGWRTIEEFRDDKILSRDEFEKLRPYMLFNAQQDPEN